MNKKTVDKLLLVLSIVLLTVGAVCFGISIFGGRKDTAVLAAALGSILLANVLNLIRQRINKNGNK